MKGIWIIVLAAVVAAVAWFLLPLGGDRVSDGDAEVLRSRRISAAEKRRLQRKIHRKGEVKVAEAEGEAARKKPMFFLEDEEERKLNAEQRKLLSEIRAALENNDRRTVIRLVQRLQKSKEWPDGIPRAIKTAAIEALGWFGSSALPEIAGFLADGDDVVVESAIEQYENALSDFDLSDRERSQILIAASKVINDEDAMDMMMFELNNMRHSVAVETILAMMDGGNAATKAVLPDNVEFYTGEEDVDRSKLKEWLKNNPDDPDDEEFYGGSKAEPES